MREFSTHSYCAEVQSRMMSCRRSLMSKQVESGGDRDVQDVEEGSNITVMSTLALDSTQQDAPSGIIKSWL